MNVYAIGPLIAMIAYIPLIIMTAGARPWQKRNTLFILFLVPAMIWNFTDFLFRGDILHVWRITLLLYVIMAFQFHTYVSSYYNPKYGRWLLFSYGSLALLLILMAFGLVLPDVAEVDGKFYPSYGPTVLFIVVPLLTVAIRNIYVFSRMMKECDNPILRNQILILLISVATLALFSLIHILPWAKEFPLAHYGNLLNAFLLSYAVLRHNLIDIKIVIRQGTAWLSLGIIGVSLFWSALMLLDELFSLQLTISASIAAVFTSLIVSMFIYWFRKPFFRLLGRAFQGERYEYRNKLDQFTDKIHNIFSLKEQGGELLSLLTNALRTRQASILFREVGGEDFIVQFMQSQERNNDLRKLRIRAGNPIIKYLEREQSLLNRQKLEVLPAFLGMWPQEKDEIASHDIQMFVPMISRKRLIAILILGDKIAGRYTLEDINIINDVTDRVAVSMEKEYLREQLREREEELSVINNCSTILSSSLDIQEIFTPFIEELKRIVDVAWGSIVLLQDDELRCTALSSQEHAEYQVGDIIPLEASGAGWVIAHRTMFLEPDIQKDHSFGTGENHLQAGLRTILYLPLIAKGRAMGCLLIASSQPYAYTQRHVKLLEQLASQIAMPLENAQLYAESEKRARVDELTGLLNRRSLDEMLDNEISRHSRYGGNFSLAIIDLDFFKTYNDTYGHLSGDNLLKDVGKQIRTTIRTTDRAFRYGGDEFAILLPQTDIEAAYQVAERVRNKVSTAIDTGDVSISASIGIACWPDDGVSHTDIIDAADITLYRVKRSGRNRTGCAAGDRDTVIPGEGEEIDSVGQKLNDLVMTLARTVDTGNHFENGYSVKAAENAVLLGRNLDLDRDALEKLETCAILADIGKISISETLLNKPGELTEDEREIMKTHPRLGAAIASNIPEYSECQQVILYHHERYDGTGYPEGLSGMDIPLEARIISIAYAFTAMTTDRPYAVKMTLQEALDELKHNAGTQFDPELVERFCSIQEKTAESAVKNSRR